MNDVNPFKEDPEIVILRRMSKLQQYGEYVVIDWDQDPDVLGERIGKCIAELIRVMDNSGVKIFHASQEIIVKRYPYTLDDYKKKREPQATVALKVMGHKE